MTARGQCPVPAHRARSYDGIVREQSLVIPVRDLWPLRGVTAAGDTDDDRVLLVHGRLPWAE
jgi:hypothetical protein